jgi:predicted nucleotidyltransferase
MRSGLISKAALLEKLKLHNIEIKSYGVKSLGLFGSFVRNAPTDNSDIDLLVDFEPGKKNFDNFMDLSFFLENLFGRKVELVTPQSLNKYIGPHILKEVEYVGI